MLNSLFNNGGCFNLTFIRERRTNWSFVSSLTAVIIFAFGQHNIARWFSFLSFSHRSFEGASCPSILCPFIYLSSVCLFLQTFFTSFYFIRDAFLVHLTSSVMYFLPILRHPFHCIASCLFTFLAQNNQPFYLSYFRSGYINSRLARKLTLNLLDYLGWTIISPCLSHFNQKWCLPSESV